ncbi:MAG: hypothetical protein IIY04_03940 [Oscillospiraceae bacterium]|nr:hypothetical protein [Oscillospiraceae bacterium]
MSDYKRMYLRLFHAVTDSIEILTKAQQDCEELYISEEEPNLIVLPSEEES